MTELGVPLNSKNKNNPFIDRYIGNLDTSSEAVTALKNISPNKLNFQKDTSTPVKSTKPSNLLLSTNDFSSNKENSLFYNSRGSTKPFSNTSFSKYKLNSTGESVDLSKYSKEDLKYYEFLCRVAEVKRWIETLIKEDLPSEIELCTGDALRNGVYLAQMAQAINPDLVSTIVPAGNKLQFKHTQNINAFFSLVENVGVPDSFRFEAQDLYNKKDLPQVYETLHILITIITKKWPGKTPTLTNLSGKIDFDTADIKKCKRTWPRIRDFKSLGVSPSSTSVVRSPFKEKPSGLINDFQKYAKPAIHINESNNELFTTPTKNILNSNMDNEEMGEKSIDEPILRNIPKLKSPVFISKKFTSPSIDADSYRPSSPYLPTPTFKDRNIFKKTPQLNYSPIKNTSLSYYSPSISKQLSYDTDFFKRRSQIRKEDIEYYRSFNYSPSRYSPVRREKMTEEEYLDNIIKLQSYCRGSNIRFNLYMQGRLIDLFYNEICSFQSVCHGYRVRRSLNFSWRLSLTQEEILSQDKLKAFILGNHTRKDLDRKRMKCLREEKIFTRLQSFARSVIIRRKSIKFLNDRESTKQPLIYFQACIRGFLIRKSLIDESLRRDIICLQNRLKASIIRKRILILSESLIQNSIYELPLLQARIRAIFIRNDIFQQVREAKKYNKNITILSAKIKGMYVRQMFEQIKDETNDSFNRLEKFQGIIRGLLVRYALDLVDDIIENNNLINLQSRIKGFLLRSSLQERDNFFRRNERFVIIIQSKIKMHLQRKAYIELIESPNPSLHSVRRFTHLLNDTGTIEGVQNDLESCQASLDAENMKKEKLQKLIRKQLDILKVLEHYEIFVGNNYHFSHICSIPNSNYPTMRKLLFLLQVNPMYWKQMYINHPQFVEDNIYLSFTTFNQKMGSREKIYFIRQICEFLQYSLNHSHTVDKFLATPGGFWDFLLKCFFEKECSSAFSLFVPVLEYISNSKISFESDPNIIYQNIYGQQPSSNVVPIEDSHVKEAFITNLRNLWHGIEMIAEIFTGKYQSIPIELKYICTKTFGLAADHNSNEIDSLRCVSKILIGTFVDSYLSRSERFGFENYQKTIVKNKIEVLVSALSKLFGFVSFEGYFEPLNQYRNEIMPHIKDILYSLMIGPEYEQDGDKMIYYDMSSEMPKLEILSQKAKEIFKMFKDNLYQYSQEDVIHELLINSKEDLIIPNEGRLFLELNPSVYRFLVSDDKMRKIYDQVKRSLIYMTQIEDVSTNLFDLVVSCILPEDEVIFQEFLARNKQVREDSIIKTLDKVSYFRLKQSTLHKIHELENANIICSTDNNLQNILNDIANTIKNPYYAINYVKQELEVTRITLSKVSHLNKELEFYLQEIKDLIDRTIKSLQKSRDFVPQNRSTFGNIKNAVRKVGNKDMMELSGLKFKWTVRQLYEKGVVEKIAGERLGEQTVKVFGSSGPRYPDIIFKISSSNGSVFGIQLLDKRKGPEKRHSDTVDSFTLENLVYSQVDEDKRKLQLLNSKVTFNTSKLLQLIIQTFFK